MMGEEVEDESGQMLGMFQKSFKIHHVLCRLSTTFLPLLGVHYNYSFTSQRSLEMPPRVSRSSLPSSTPKSTSKPSRKAIRKRDKRSLNAFAIAQETDPERLKIRRNRLGEVEKDEQPQRKRQRMADDDEEEDDDDEVEQPRRKQQKGGFDDLDMSAGSDSEGNEWRMGVVDDDDDEEIDSDEAFGESDEERFGGWTFRASSKGPRVKKGGAPKKDVNLDEDDEDMNDEEEDDDDLGEDAIDLAAALDQYDEMESADEADYEDDQKAKSARKKQKAQDSEDEQDEDDSNSDSAPSEDDGEMSDNFPDFDNESDDNNAEKIKQLHSVVASLPQDDATHEPNTQADSSTTAARMLAALKGMSGVDPTLTRSLKTISRNTETSRASSKAATNNGLLKAPLPKRQQDRIDRAAAYDKAKETLNRWIDTVKHNRRAEHLTFPLIDPLAQEAQGTSKLLPFESSSKPRSELENTIANILQASGLGGMSTKVDEAQLVGFEELKSNKLPLEEVLARRAELRKARDLMFREEARSKRVKKIKSKAYRRIHRKEAQRTAQKERDLLTAAGVEMSEDEDEVADRKRAEARMGARHKESKWAKSMKETGRAGWDGDARDAMTVAARKNEEVMMRKEGRRIRDSDASSEDESEDDDGDDVDDGGEFTLRSQLDKLDDDGGAEFKASKSGISQLAFMQRADAARKKQNEEDIQRMKRELAGEESDDEEMLQPTETSIGRRIFGPSQTTETSKPAVTRNELEEGRSDSEDEDGQNIDSEEFPNSEAQPTQSRPAKAKAKSQLQGPATKAKPHVSIRSAPPTTSPSNREGQEQEEEATLNLQQSSHPNAVQHATAPSNTDGWTVVHHNDNDNDNDSTSDISQRLQSRSPSPTNLELVQAAFGSGDDTATFGLEKTSLAAAEDTQVTSTALPGWGSWAGSGLTKGERHHASKSLSNPALVKKSADGISADKRRDKKLKDVIISERRNKKGAKYLAPTLPHQFETKAQYERSLRLPIGPEWTTKETFQGMTKPRVLLKKGVVVQPMRRPMV